MTDRRLAYVEPWTADRVMARLREAALCLQTAETNPGGGGKTTWWPDYVHDRTEAYGYAAVSNRAPKPDAQAIGRMDVSLRWVTTYLSNAACAAAGLPEDAGWLVMARAMGWSHARIGKARKARWGGTEQRGGGRSLVIPGGNARPSLVKIEQAALAHLASTLNRTGSEVDREARQARPAPLNPPGRDVPAVQGIRTIAPARGDAPIADQPLVRKVVPVRR